MQEHRFSQPGDSVRYDVSIDLSNTNSAHTQLVLLTGYKKKVLEVGPATGYITEILQQRNCRVTAIEMDPIAAGRAMQFCERIIVADVEKVDFASTLQNERFDVVLFGDILEHLVDPQWVLREVSGLLHSSGYVVASIPNIAHASIRLALLAGNVRDTKKGLPDKTHRWFFTRESIEELFRDAGYEIQTLQRITADPFATEQGLEESDYPPSLVAPLRRDPEAITYQFVVRARLAAPAEASARTPSPPRLKASSSFLGALLGVPSLQESEIASLRHRVDEKDEIIAELNSHLLAIQGTIGWKLLERLRRVRDRLLPPNSRRRNLCWTFRRVVEVVLDEGLQAVLRKMVHKIRMALRGQGILVKAPPQGVTRDQNGKYQLWLQRHELTPKDVERMKAAVETFTYTPLISIVTRVYDTDETWLRNAIESVRAQIYLHWELCLVNDASTKPHVQLILDEYAAIDQRIKVKHVLENEGTAGASNNGLNLAAGEFVGLLDQDGELSPEASFEVVKRLNEGPRVDLLYSDEDKLEMNGRRVEPFFKPGWSPDLLLSVNYMGHFSVFRRSLLREIGGFRCGYDGSEHYDLLLRVTERTDKIAHIPKVLYHRRKTPGSAAASTASEPCAHEGGRRALQDALVRRGCEGWVESILPGFYTARYRLRGTPLVSVIVPTRDRWRLLRQCLSSLEERTSYSRYEIIVLDNDSSEPETLNYLQSVANKWRVYQWPGLFNFAAINNFGAAQAKGDYLLFLNNDIQVIRADWLTAMLEQAQRPEVGAVGAKFLYPDGRIQHAGLVLGVGGVAGHAFKYSPGNALNYFGLADVVRNCSAVTAACMMVPRRVFEEVRGFDERFRVAFNDVDFCLKLRQRGYLIVYTPLALLYHHEGASRGRVYPLEDERLFRKVWGDLIKVGDPYYNPNLTLSREDWSLRL